MSATLSASTLLAVPMAPLVGAALAGLFGTKFGGNHVGRTVTHSLTILGVFVAFIISAMTLALGPVTLGHYLSVGAILFALSVIGIFLNRKNLIVLLMCIELMLLAVNMNFVAFSHYLGDMHGQIFVFFILTVAAAESAIGLALLVLLFRNKSSINVDELNTLKG